MKMMTCMLSRHLPTFLSSVKLLISAILSYNLNVSLLYSVICCCEISIWYYFYSSRFGDITKSPSGVHTKNASGKDASLSLTSFKKDPSDQDESGDRESKNMEKLFDYQQHDIQTMNVRSDFDVMSCLSCFLSIDIQQLKHQDWTSAFVWDLMQFRNEGTTLHPATSFPFFIIAFFSD